MPKVLVTYFSQTGNTKLIAEAIYDSIDQEKVILPMDQADDLKPYGLIFIGFPVHAHSVPYKAEVFLKKLLPEKKIALFSTYGSIPGTRLSQEALEHATILVSKAKLLGVFSCRGKVSLQAREILSRSPEHEEWADMAASASAHPDVNDIADAKAFARWILTKSAHGHF